MTEEQRLRAFREALRQLEGRIKLFAALPINKLDKPTTSAISAPTRRSDEHDHGSPTPFNAGRIGDV